MKIGSEIELTIFIFRNKTNSKLVNELETCILPSAYLIIEFPEGILAESRSMLVLHGIIGGATCMRALGDELETAWTNF